MHDNHEIETLRPPRNTLNPDIPYHFIHEREPDANGALQSVNTVFLTGKECSFKCLMCDLWKNTLTGPTPTGAILNQLDYALERLPTAEIIKLYNSSNFFDPKAVPLSDYPGIFERMGPYKRVIVENHPKLCGENCVEFSQRLNGKLEIAMGLESIHPDVLPRLNKQLTPADFEQAARFLRDNDIDVRAFILLNPPYLTDVRENIDWAIRAVKFAFDSGAQCCSIIATRSGNGIMEKLQQRGLYSAPMLSSLEEVFDEALKLNQGRVFADTWDLGFLSNCPKCFTARKERLELMNLGQRQTPGISCDCHE